MRAHLMWLSALLGACAGDPTAPGAVMVGEWHYASAPVVRDEPSLNAGVHVTIAIESANALSFRGRVTLWFAGDVGVPAEIFGPVAGNVGNGGTLTFVIPVLMADASPISVVGVVTGDVLVVGECRQGLEPGPFVPGGQFRRSS